MNYTIHDMTAYGIYNGISALDIREFTAREASVLGIDILDYSCDEIARKLRHDPELKQLAQDTYTPYPEHDRWTEETKVYYRKEVANRTAPGKADIPDDLVYAKIRAELCALAERILPARQAAAEAAERERAEIMQHIKNIETEKKDIYDEGGKTVLFTHRVTMKSGAVFTFADRNIFDFGRVINPCYPILPDSEPGGIVSKLDDGTLSWSISSPDGGFMDARPLSEDEIYAYFAIVKYCGFADPSQRQSNYIRM